MGYNYGPDSLMVWGWQLGHNVDHLVRNIADRNKLFFRLVLVFARH
jgi:hypothetical protein